jgi:hypothetical protein
LKRLWLRLLLQSSLDFVGVAVPVLEDADGVMDDVETAAKVGGARGGAIERGTSRVGSRLSAAAPTEDEGDAHAWWIWAVDLTRAAPVDDVS